MRYLLMASVVATALLATVKADGEKQGCSTVSFGGVAIVGQIEVAPGVFTLGAFPTPTTIGGVPGLLGSIITEVKVKGSKGQGAQHYTLIHTFVSTDPERPGSFVTSDQAVGVPAGKDPNTAIINDVLTIVAGDGIFENVEGFLVNHAILDLAESTLTTLVHGHLCADGI